MVQDDSEDRAPSEAGRDAEKMVTRHLRAGYWALFVYLLFGAALEGMHAFKVGAYLDVGNETRRLLFRLAHAHGTLFALVQIAFAVTVRARPRTATIMASAGLLAALFLLPMGFFLGGLTLHDGDPGLGIALVPAGVLAAAVGVFAVARRL